MNEVLISTFVAAVEVLANGCWKFLQNFTRGMKTRMRKNLVVHSLHVEKVHCQSAHCINGQKERWLWCYHWCQLWCCFSLSWSKSICNPETGITRFKGPWRLLPLIKREHLEREWTSRLPPMYLPQGQASRFPYGRLNISSMTGGLKVVVCIGNEVLGRSPIWVLFQPMVA